LEIALAISSPSRRASTKNENAVLVHIVDQICQGSGLGYRYELTEAVAGSLEQVWSTLSQWIPHAANYYGEQCLTLIEQQVGAAHT
jgi:hypothetical protein